MFWHPRMSGYIMEPFRDPEDFQGAIRNVLKGPKQPNWWFSKETAVLTYFFQGYQRDPSCSGLLACQGTWWNQKKTMKTSKEPSGTSKKSQKSQNNKKGNAFWTLHISGYLMESIIDHADFQGTNRNIKKGLKQPNGWFSKETAALTHFFLRLLERLKLFWTSYRSRKIMEPRGDNEDFKGAVMNVYKGQNGKKG